MNWARSRLRPLLLLSAAVGAALGFLRAHIGFLVGLQGMAVGMALGCAAGRLGRGDPGRYWSFPQRVWLALDMVLVVGAAQLLVVSALRSEAGQGALSWLLGVLGGSEREGFASISGVRFLYRAVSGRLSGGWWAVMNALDLGLMAFLSLAGHMLTLPPGEREHQGEKAAARAFPLLLSAAVLLPLGWGFAARGVERRATTRAAAGVVGTWELEGWDKLVGPNKRFFLLEPRDTVHDLGGASEAEPRWGLLLTREGGGFAGTLELPSGKSLPASLRPRPDGALELSAGSEAAVARRR